MQVNARDWIVEATNDAGTTWTEIDGLKSFNLNPGEGEETADTTTFKSAGEREQQVMQRGATMTVSGQYITDDAGVQDPGQAEVETLASKVGEASVGGVRFRHKSQTEWTEWDATATLGEQGGETNNKTTWGATFTRSGAARTEAVVAA